MHPTVTEQLDGVRRILEDVIALELKDVYPSDILAGVCATLETLAHAWSDVAGFLRWDSGASATVIRQLLDSSAGELDPELVRELTQACAAEPPDAADLPALEAHHLLLRGALERAVPHIAQQPELADVNAALVELFRRRAERYPLKTIWRPAGGEHAHRS